ncbi:hypothetical protein BDZ91DRAFT_499944 [Kalaharituber pfeilii]|nr:hypothetical protein BDZ91DRAFT_499944 [Kalaharituber pfeilii]
MKKKKRNSIAFARAGGRMDGEMELMGLFRVILEWIITPHLRLLAFFFFFSLPPSTFCSLVSAVCSSM